MQKAIVAGFSAIGFAVAGWAMPLVFPKVSQDIARGSLLVSITLLIVALVLWALDRKSSDEGSRQVSQTHSGHGHNIVADAVNIGAQHFDMTEQVMQQIAGQLRPGEPVLVGWSNAAGSANMGEKLQAFLAAKGFPNGGTMAGGHISALNPDTPVSIHPNGLLGGLIGGGAQAVYVDASIAPKAG